MVLDCSPRNPDQRAGPTTFRITRRLGQFGHFSHVDTDCSEEPHRQAAGSDRYAGFPAASCDPPVATPELAIPCGDHQVIVRSEEFHNFTPSAFGAAIYSYGNGQGYFEPLRRHFHPNMKTVRYSPQGKLLTLFFSLLVGCPYTSSINRELRPYPTLAQVLNMDSFPEQSQVSRLLQEMTASDLGDIALAFEETLRQHSRSGNSSLPVTVDVDTTGLVADGDTYEGARKGYFSEHKGKRGYQLNTAYVPEYGETLAVLFDPGNVPPGARFVDVMYAVAEVLGGWERIGLVRADSAQGTMDYMRFLLEHSLDFLLRGHNSRTSRNLALPVPECLWETVDWGLQATEGPPIYFDLPDERRVAVRTILSRCWEKDRWAYRHLCTTLPGHGPQALYPVDVVQLYNQRGGSIEIDFKGDKGGIFINHLRTRSFYGIWTFLITAFMAANLLSLFGAKQLADTSLQSLGTNGMVHKLLRMPGRISVDGKITYITIPTGHPMTEALIR
jgi:hypothetical protein